MPNVSDNPPSPSDEGPGQTPAENSDLGPLPQAIPDAPISADRPPTVGGYAGQDALDLATGITLGVAVKFVSDSPASGQVGRTGGTGSPIDNVARVARRAFPGATIGLSIPHKDPYSRFEAGLAELERRIGTEHESYPKVIDQHIRLFENIEMARDYGNDEHRRTERNEILGNLNNLSLATIGVAFIDLCVESETSSVTVAPGEKVAPSTPADVGRWYVGLSPLEQCFVIATACLYGAPTHEVSRAARELFGMLERAAERRAEAQRRGDGRGADRDHEGGPSQAPTVVLDDLLQGIFIRIEKYDGTERMLWQDDHLARPVSTFIARQATAVGITFDGQNLLDILRQWAVSDSPERAWRAARTLAQIWWRQDQSELIALAGKWARSDRARVWQSASAMLYGAYEAERDEQADVSADTAVRSVMLDELRQWAMGDDHDGLGWVAAFAYGLVGHRWPQTALDGLDTLLRIAPGTDPDDAVGVPFEFVVLGMLIYNEIAGAGHIRAVLDHLAAHAVRFAYQSRMRQSPREPEGDRRQREVGLQITFFIILFLAARSLSAAREHTVHRYSLQEPLSPHPAFPDERGHDVILAGILAEPEQKWRASVTSVLCAAVAEGSAGMVFDLLRAWGDIVSREPASTAREAYIRFVVNVAHDLHQWDQNLGRTGIRGGYDVFKNQLRLWALSGNDALAIRDDSRRLAQAIQRSLSSNT